VKLFVFKRTKNINLDDLSGEGFQNECISFWVSRS